MSEKLDLVELLKNCPEGMELDCAIYDNATFSKIDFDNLKAYPIIIQTNSGHEIRLTRYGTYMLVSEAKCLIFPKGKTTWEGFVPPNNFKDGDIVIYGEDQFAIFKELISHQDTGDLINYYLYFDEGMNYLDKGCGRCVIQRFATEEEVERLFKALQVNGYQWDAENKTLKPLEVSEQVVEPKFKVGDMIINTIGNRDSAPQVVISGIDDNNYILNDGDYIPISDQSNWELVSNTLRSKFKNGDILYVDCSSNGTCGLYQYTFILKEITNEHIRCYCYIDKVDSNKEFETCNLTSIKYTPRHATEEEKRKLFDVIKENGYNWNHETKTLEKLELVEPNFNDGDIVANKSIGGTWIGIYHEHNSNRTFSSYCYMRRDGVFSPDSDTGHTYCKTRLATDEEKQKLFNVIEKNGYRWNSKTKTLEKLITPKFKVGDIIQSKDRLQAYTVSNVTFGYYSLNGYENKHAGIIPVEDQDNWILVKKEKFDPKTLKPFDMVLVTDATHGVWSAGFFSHMDQCTHSYPFMVNGARYRYCIPYNDATAHLLGKSGKAPEYYRYWEDKV